MRSRWVFTSSMINGFKKLSGGSVIPADSLRIINRAIDSKADSEITAVELEGDDKRFVRNIVVSAADSKKYYGLRVTVHDKIYGGKVIAGSGRTFLYLGGDSPNQLLTISVETDELKTSIRRIKNYEITVSGKIIRDKEKPYVFLTNPNFEVNLNEKSLRIGN